MAFNDSASPVFVDYGSDSALLRIRDVPYTNPVAITKGAERCLRVCEGVVRGGGGWPRRGLEKADGALLHTFQRASKRLELPHRPRIPPHHHHHTLSQYSAANARYPRGPS